MSLATSEAMCGRVRAGYGRAGSVRAVGRARSIPGLGRAVSRAGAVCMRACAASEG